MEIEFHPDAIVEMDVAAGWYAERSASAARDFVVAVDLAIESLKGDPLRFPSIDHRHRGCSVKRFPFQIVFRHDENLIEVIAIAHAKRRPGYWRER